MSDAKNKAIELVEKFTMDNTRQGERNGIKSALIAVDEIMLHIRFHLSYGYEKQLEWRQEVKNELEKL